LAFGEWDKVKTFFGGKAMKEKLKKLQIKGFVAGVLVSALLSATLVIANTQSQLIEVFYGVNIVVNGIPQNFPVDMTPFISSGRTFLPVRGISEALGVPVEWHGPTSTVYVGTSPHGAPFWTATPFFERSGSGMTTSAVSILGQSYANAINYTGTWEGWSNHNLNNQFNTLTGIIGRIDGTTGAELTTISFIGDGRSLASFSVSENTAPQDISVDVKGVLVLRIEINHTNQALHHGARSPRVAFANAMIQ